MFNGLEDKFTEDEFLNFEFENKYHFGYFRGGMAAEIKLTWEGGEQTVKTEIYK